MNLGKVGVIVAARMGSRRLPGKALLPLQGIPMTEFLLRRLRPLRSGKVVLATTELPTDDHVAALAARTGVPVYRGAETDLVARYVGAARKFGFDTVARVTADCPFVEADLVDSCVRHATALDRFDLATTKGSFPVGLDVEIYHAGQMALLHESRELTVAHREHLTLYFYDHPEEFDMRRTQPPLGWAATSCSFTVDTAADYERAQALAARFDQPNFSARALITKASL
jgi:spore coat polysaccharide biosynthesis protein SpsF